MTEKNLLEYWVDPNTWTFKGDFEGMYRDFEDPWNCKDKVSELYRDVALMMIFKNRCFQRILDIGCGLGAFTERLRVANSGGAVLGVDVSERAVRKARENYPESRFEAVDVTHEPLPSTDTGWDLIVLSEVIWYVLPQLMDVLKKIHTALAPTGVLFIQQFFPYDQHYGLQLLKSAQELHTRYLYPAGFRKQHEFVELLDNGTLSLISLTLANPES